MDIPSFHQRLADIAGAIQFVIDAEGPPAMLVEELEGAALVAEELEATARQTLDDFPELAVQIVEELGYFREFAAHAVEAIKTHWHECASDDPYWDRGEHPWVIERLKRSHNDSTARLVHRVKAHVSVYGKPSDVEGVQLTGGKIKPDPGTLKIIKMIQRGVDDTDTLCHEGGKSAGTIRQIKSRLRRGLYDL